MAEPSPTPQQVTASMYNIRNYGAKGDGITLDTDAINSTIESASKSGGGTVLLPAGVYPSHTIRLRSNITLQLDSGATLLAAYPTEDGKGYDAPESSEGASLAYQDFGHSYWHNSLICGEGLENVAIIGMGRIDGRGLCGAHHVQREGEALTPFADENGYELAEQPGQANKAIALKLCRNVTLKDFSLYRGGHFALLATGVDTLTIDNLKVDTNRDGFDIDACRNVRISNCSVNSPHDDAIVLKSSYALGHAVATENITITNCFVSGYSIGSLLDGTFDRSFQKATDGDGPTGRIKLGTESNGGFKNIAISNCVFDRCRGLAIESVDGGVIEDVAVCNLTMRDIVNAPLFVYLGNRARGPQGTGLGAIRGLTLTNIRITDADPRYAAQIVGQPGAPIENIRIQNVDVRYRTGITLEQVAQQPLELVNPFFLGDDKSAARGPRDPFEAPERPQAYPEPSMFGLLPAKGFYIRHARRIDLRDVALEPGEDDDRPLIVLDDVRDTVFENLSARDSNPAPSIQMRRTRNLTAIRFDSVPEGKLPEADNWLSL